MWGPSEYIMYILQDVIECILESGALKFQEEMWTRHENCYWISFCIYNILVSRGYSLQWSSQCVRFLFIYFGVKQ
jgi:hypothetical protein